jgi:hypothetical protein
VIINQLQTHEIILDKATSDSINMREKIIEGVDLVVEKPQGRIFPKRGSAFQLSRNSSILVTIFDRSRPWKLFVCDCQDDFENTLRVGCYGSVLSAFVAETHVPTRDPRSPAARGLGV